MAAYRENTPGDLLDDLYSLAREPRQLDGDERRTVKRLVSDRVRELVPYVDGVHGERLGYHIERSVRKADKTLSSRECEVLVEMMLGKTDQAIADELRLSLHTVKSHVKHILEKLGARNRVHAAVLVLSVTEKSDTAAAASEVASPSYTASPI